MLCRMAQQKEQIFVSVSKQISGLRQIYKSYQFAEKMSDLLCICQVPGENRADNGKIIFYKDLGIYRVLLTLTDKEAIKEYEKKAIEELKKAKQHIEKLIQDNTQEWVYSPLGTET